MPRLLIAVSLALPFALTTGCKSSRPETTEVVVLCPDCGVEKGSQDCCDPDAERCADCGKIEGSEGCCE